MEYCEASGKGRSPCDPSPQKIRYFVTVRTKVDGLVKEWKDYTVSRWVSVRL